MPLCWRIFNLSTMLLRDGVGNLIVVEKPLAPGRAAASASRPVVLSTEDLAALSALAAALGEVDDSPTANTVLDRLKVIAASLTTLSSTTDGLEALVTTLNGYVDGLEALVTAGNATATAISGYVDGLESLVGSINTGLAAILAKISADPATQTTLAAVLAKISGDPATQTTLAAILAKIIAAPATEAKQDTLLAALQGLLSTRRPALTFTTVAGSPFTLTAAWAKVATTTNATKGLHIAPIAAATVFDIEWAVVAANASAPTDTYGEPIQGGENFLDGIPIGDIYCKSTTGQIAIVRAGA